MMWHFDTVVVFYIFPVATNDDDECAGDDDTDEHDEYNPIEDPEN